MRKFVLIVVFGLAVGALFGSRSALYARTTGH